MKVRFVLACAAAGIAASAFGTLTANAETATFSGSIGFSSDVVKPGEKVDIFGTCDDPAFTTAQVRSSILDAPDLRVREDGSGGKSLVSHAKVKKDATPEFWPVSFMCGGEMVSGHLRVAVDTKPGPPRVHLIQTKGHPGDKIWVGVYCETSATPTSAALTFGAMSRVPDGRAPDLPLFGTHGTVKNVKPGAYKVSAKCGGKTISTTFTVLGKNVSAPAAQRAQVPVKPKGAADTGEIVADNGDSTQIAGQPADDGTTALVLGAAGLLLASTGAGAWFYRRLRRA